MSNMLTFHGDMVDLVAPDAAIIRLETIACHLGSINRFSGATRRPAGPDTFERRPYSVAEHSLLALEIAEAVYGTTDPAARLAVLMHDGHEAYLNDSTQPYKSALRMLGGASAAEYLDRSWYRAVGRKFGILTAQTSCARLIHACDMVALATEKRDLLPPHTYAWPCLNGFEPAAWVNLIERDPHEDYSQQFFDAAESLLAEIADRHH